LYLYWVPERRWHQVLLGVVTAARRLTTRMSSTGILHALCYPLAAVLMAVFVVPYRVLPPDAGASIVWRRPSP